MSGDYRYDDIFKYGDIFKLNDITVNGRVLGNSGGVLTMTFEVPADYEPFTGLSLQDEMFFNTVNSLKATNLYTLVDRLKQDNFSTYNKSSVIPNLSYDTGGGDGADSKDVRRLYNNYLEYNRNASKDLKSTDYKSIISKESDSYTYGMNYSGNYTGLANYNFNTILQGPGPRDLNRPFLKWSDLSGSNSDMLIRGSSEAKPGGMIVSESGVQFIADYEQYYGTPYRGQDSQNLTIGYGHVVLEGEDFSGGITKEQAFNLLKEEINTKYAPSVNRWAHENDVTLTQQQFDALVSFAYNAGTGALPESTLGRYIKSGEKSEMIQKAFLMWVRVGDSHSAGLWRRRMDEANMFNYGDYKRDYPEPPLGYE